MLPCLKYKRKIIAGPESTTSVNDANCAKTDQLIICLNNIWYKYIYKSFIKLNVLMLLTFLKVILTITIL